MNESKSIESTYLITLDREDERIVLQKLSQSTLRVSGDLLHLFREALLAELAAEIVQRSGLALVDELLQKEQEGHVAYLLVLFAVHFGRFGWRWVSR